MAGKKKTTFAKLARERKLQERRLEKKAKKEARKLAGPMEPTEPDGTWADDDNDAHPFDDARASFDAADAVR